MRRILGFCLLGFGLFVPMAVGQTTEAEITSRLMGKPLFLRGGWAEDHLKFLSDGSLEQTYKTGSFTVSGFDTSSIEIKKDGLRIRGRRVGLEFARDGSVKRVKLGGVQVEIAGPPGTDFTKALDAVFAPDLESLKPALPNYWRDLAARNFVPYQLKKRDPGGADATPAADQPAHVGGKMLPPRILRQVDAVFSPEARSLKYSGDTVVECIVNPDGAIDVSHLQIMSASGMGLDERALYAVSQYKFASATQDGVPLKVVISVDVNFKLY